MRIFSVIVGSLLFGIVFNGIEGLLVGAALGFLLGWNISLSRTLRGVQEQLKEPPAGEGVRKRITGRVEQARTDRIPASAGQGEEPFAKQLGKNVPKPVDVPTVTPPRIIPQGPTVVSQQEQGTSSNPDFFSRVSEYVKAFFTQGNVVLRVGLLVLFFGVAFLLKYAADHSLLPIELRLLGVALAGLALLVFGWFRRLQRPGFSVLVQGGGVGLLFLTVFAAGKQYGLVPLSISFALMVGLVCTSAALALLQDAKSLAFFGATGGFLAPVLLSTGNGNHVALFGFYTFLNAGILAIAWFKAWRELNLLGFIFTLAIGSLWGARAYQPQYFSTTEPFLIVFFLMFTTMAVLFAFRQPPKLRGYVDGSLVFGTPIICFSLQAALVGNMEYGMAISALVLSFFYVGVAILLRNRGDAELRRGMRTLTEAFLALGVVFLTLAVPLALSGNWTAVTWALEGGALVWVGIRQQRVIPRNFGCLLQVGAALFFLTGTDFSGDRMVLLNGVFLGCLGISLAALFSSWSFFKAGALYHFERKHHLFLFIWGILWWLAGGILEIDRQLPHHYEYQTILLFIGVSCLCLVLLVPRLSWPIAAYPGLGLLPVMALVVLAGVGRYGVFSSHHLFADYGFLSWPLAFVLLYQIMYRSRQWLPNRLLQLTHVGGFLLLVLVVTLEAGWQVHDFTSGAGTWTRVAWGLIPVAFIRVVHSAWLGNLWPLEEYDREYRQQGSGILAVLVWVWLLVGCLMSRGNAIPLPFIPVLNPLELSQLTVMLVLVRWVLRHRDFVAEKIPDRVLASLAGGTAFIWINSVLARAIHQLRGVPFTPDAMMDSRFYQASVSILWAILSLSLMTVAGRRQNRVTWFAGSVLIGCTVLKLFLIDLAKSGTVERIVSFLAVGILLLVIGYFAPLPPVLEDAQEERP